MTSTAKSCKDASASPSTSTPSKYSTKQRNCTTVPAPPAKLLDIADLYANPSDSNDKPNLEKLKQHIISEGRLTEQAALRIIESGKHAYFIYFHY